MSWVEWVSVLKLSLMWQMNLIHDLALQKIEARINNTDEWITVLKISTQLRIKGLRDLANRMLRSTLGPLEKIELATECCIEPWLLEGYIEFATRAEVISVQEEERLGWDRVANLFRVRHRQLDPFSKSCVQLGSDIRITFASEFANIAVFDNSPISYLQPELHTAVDPGIIEKDKTYYHVYIILSVNFFTIISTHVEAHPTHCRWKTLYSSFLAVCSRRAQRYSRTCFCFLLQMTPLVMDLVTNNPFFFMGCARRPFDG